MSADTTPISLGRFAAALKDLSIDTLHLKVIEIRNAIAHLRYSNDQLQPFADGTASADEPPCQISIDAIRENEDIIDRMAERIAVVRIEVEDRGVSWTEFQSRDELLGNDDDKEDKAQTNGDDVNGHSEQQQHSVWSDGTFQTGTIRNGEVRFDSQPGRPEGGSLSDEELRQALEERMRNLSHDDDDTKGGMHL